MKRDCQNFDSFIPMFIILNFYPNSTHFTNTPICKNIWKSCNYLRENIITFFLLLYNTSLYTLITK